MQAGTGDTVRRKEDLRLLTGRGCYSDDFNFPGQAYAVTLRSPHAHAVIRAIDAAAARAMPGVLAVLTGADARANRDGPPVPVAPHHLLPTERVRHVGTAIAFVIAESVAAAKDAAERIVVDYAPLPVVTDAKATAERGAPRLYDDMPNVMID